MQVGRGGGGFQPFGWCTRSRPGSGRVPGPPCGQPSPGPTRGLRGPRCGWHRARPIRGCGRTWLGTPAPCVTARLDCDHCFGGLGNEPLARARLRRAPPAALPVPCPTQVHSAQRPSLRPPPTPRTQRLPPLCFRGRGRRREGSRSGGAGWFSGTNHGSSRMTDRAQPWEASMHERSAMIPARQRFILCPRARNLNSLAVAARQLRPGSCWDWGGFCSGSSSQFSTSSQPTPHLHLHTAPPSHLYLWPECLTVATAASPARHHAGLQI